MYVVPSIRSVQFLLGHFFLIHTNPICSILTGIIVRAGCLTNLQSGQYYSAFFSLARV